jgi:hypothetical protein
MNTSGIKDFRRKNTTIIITTHTHTHTHNTQKKKKKLFEIRTTLGNLSHWKFPL